MILGSPAVNIYWFVLIYALLAPTAWPVASRNIDAARTELEGVSIAPSSSP
jgi:hypothetical protein